MATLFVLYLTSQLDLSDGKAFLIFGEWNASLRIDLAAAPRSAGRSSQATKNNFAAVVKYEDCFEKPSSLPSQPFQAGHR